MAKNSPKIWFDRRASLLYFLLLLLLPASFLWGESFFFWVIEGRIAFLDKQIVWFTTYGFLGLLGLFALGTVWLWNKTEKRMQVPLILALLSAFFLSHFVKFIFQDPRPYDLFEIIPLVRERTLSFPSTHAALAFAVFPLLRAVRPNWGWVWLVIAFGVAFSRIYLGVHLPREVVVGALLGLAIGDLWRILVQHYGFLDQWEERFELRRQTFHAVFGLILTFLLKWDIIPTHFVLVIALVGLILSFLSLRFPVPIISYFLQRFERKRLLHTFPGRGAFFFVFSAWLVLVLFDFQVALAAILILALLDSTAHLVGKYWGRIPNPLNPRKHLEGFFAGVCAGLFGALFFVPIVPALVGVLAGGFIEIFELQIAHHKIDDNLTVPLVSALAMSLLVS